MAAWQFDVHLIPKERLTALVGVHPISISPELLDETRWWEGEGEADLLDGDLATFLCKTKSWSPEIDIWGEEDGNRIDVVYENDEVVEVLVALTCGSLIAAS